MIGTVSYFKEKPSTFLNRMEENATLASELSPFEYQVAGHATKSISGNIGILKHKDGYILKPINKLPQGDNELSFYERLNLDKEFLPIKKYIPEYFGHITLKINNTDVRFLKLKDITSGLCKPCVMDVKIGKQTWDPNASFEKRAAEDAKYVECKREYGFCIPGYIVFNIKTGKFEKIEKEDGKKLGKESTLNAFKHFLNIPCRHSHIVMSHMINSLNELLKWWSVQTSVHIFSSSILLAYDVAKLEEMDGNNTLNIVSDINKWVKVYMIDFAHVFPAENKKDWNYLLGISRLVEVLKMLV